MSSDIPTIYEWAGGRPGFERWLGRFYDLVENDELVASPGIGDVPELLRSRLLSVRAYDDASLMREADVVDGRELEAVVERMFGDSGNSYLHVHFARPGRYACRIDRA